MTLRRPLRTPAEQAQPLASVGLCRRLVLVLASLAPLALIAATPTLAASSRSYVSKIEPGSVKVGENIFEDPAGLTIDPSDNVWISVCPRGNVNGDCIHSTIYEYGPYPSQTKVATQPDEHGQARGGSGGALAVDSANDDLYVTANETSDVDVYNPLGEFVPPQWEFDPTGEYGESELAVDNSGGESNGRVYVLRTYFEQSDTIAALSPEDAPIDFTAHEEYISGNKITEDPVTLNRASFYDPVVDPINGDLYVQVFRNNTIEVFSPSGELLKTLPIGAGFEDPMAFDPTTGNLLIDEGVIDEYSPSGELLGHITGTSPSTPLVAPGQIAVNSEGYLYVVEHHENVVDIFSPKVVVPKIGYQAVSEPTPTSGDLTATINPSEAGEEVTTCHFEYGTDLSFGLGTLPCLTDSNAEVGTPAAPIISTTEVHAAVFGLATDTPYYYRVVAGNARAAGLGANQHFIPRAVQGLQTEAATNVEATSATLHGSFRGNGQDTHYYFEYGTDKTYGNITEPEEDAGTGSGTVDVAPVSISGLQPAATYHFRIVARNAAGTTYGPDEKFTTLTKPSIESFYSSDLTSTSAVLHATINPQGGDTTYHFEYGTTTSYGSSAPMPLEEITANLLDDHSVEVEITNLEEGATYHFRVVAESKYGKAVSEDQSFGFHPPNCPNAHLRQITNSSNLPDCRAYELVSPDDAGGTALFPEGPNSAEEPNPPRFAFGGLLATIPGSGEPINDDGDLYVATRTDEGWITRYVGFPKNQALKDDGPPNEPTTGQILNSPAGVRADSSMNEFLDWNDGNEGNAGVNVEYNFTPHVWAADGTSLGEWPTTPGYSAQHSFELNQSADFTHFVFQEGELPSLSLIDNDTVSHTATKVSLLPDGGPIPVQLGDTDPNSESLSIPAISSDGSRILMGARAESEEPCKDYIRGYELIKCPVRPPSLLYMRVNDLVTYEVSQGHAVDYVGMTPDGSKVYFTSEEHLTHEDEDHGGASLFMWSSEKEEHKEFPLTLISKGDNNGEAGKPGNTSNCNASWTAQCGIVTYSNNAAYTGTQGFTYGDLLGNGLSDNSIASANGDVYFFSPEQLVGGKGVNGEENLYDYRDERVQYVTTLEPQKYCSPDENGHHWCSVGPVLRMQVSPDDSYMAFLTASRLTSYNNAGFLEMYRYRPSTEQLICVSCLPSGEPPTSNVEASSNGLFMTNDGRTFFSTGDPLVPADTDGLRDVYEFVEGHARLISSGTSSVDHISGIAAGLYNELFVAGLVGVTGNGVNVYFSTYDTLVGQDRNGSQLKFYDARTNGGFPYLAPAAPCEAADECHGVGSSPEEDAQNGSGAELGKGGNVGASSSGSHLKRKKKHRRRRHRRSRTGGRSRRGKWSERRAK